MCVYVCLYHDCVNVAFNFMHFQSHCAPVMKTEWKWFSFNPPKNTTVFQAREEERRENFARLVMMDGQDLLPNPEPVDCRICYVDLQPAEGVLLRECLHCFCR